MREDFDFREKKTISEAKTKTEMLNRGSFIAIVDISHVNNGGLLI